MHEENEQQEQQYERALVQRGGVAELIVKAAATANKLIIENCSLCTLYCDKQVQYESAAIEQYMAGGALHGLFSQVDTSAEVQQYRGMLFDEESVVTSVSSRLED